MNIKWFAQKPDGDHKQRYPFPDLVHVTRQTVGARGVCWQPLLAPARDTDQGWRKDQLQSMGHVTKGEIVRPEETLVHGVFERKTLRQRRKLMVILCARWGRGWNWRKCSVHFLVLHCFLHCLSHAFFQKYYEVFKSQPALHKSRHPLRKSELSQSFPLSLSLSLSFSWISVLIFQIHISTTENFLFNCFFRDRGDAETLNTGRHVPLVFMSATATSSHRSF